MNSIALVALVNDLVDPTDYTPSDAPSAKDLADYAAWLASRDDLTPQAMEPTPIEALVEPEPEDDDDDTPWWASLPTCPALDTPIRLAEEPVRARSMRLDPEEDGRACGLIA